MSDWGRGVWGLFAWGPSYAATTRTATSQQVDSRSSVSSYYLSGNILALEFECYQGSDWVSPNLVTLTIKPPTGGNTVINNPTALALGRYRHLFDTEGLAPGVYRYRWQGDGVYECANEGSFEILASEVL